MSCHSEPQETSKHTDLYRQHMAGLDISIQEIDALIDVVRSILSYFVDQAFNVQTDQITLQYIGKIGFNETIYHATIERHPENQTASVRNNGVESDCNPLGKSEP